MSGIRHAPLAGALLAFAVTCLAQRPEPPPPPPPSVPAVTRAEAEAVLAALRDAWSREDAQAVERLYDTREGLAVRASRDARKLFKERNAFKLLTTVHEERSLADGGLRLELLLDMTSRAVDQSRPRREKRRWAFDFARRPGTGVVVAFQTAAEGGLLPPDPPWRETSVRGRVLLQGAATDERRIRLELTCSIENVSAAPASELGFALHPFSSGLALRAGDADLALHRTEASLDAWRTRLPAAVPPGGSVEVRFAYELEQPGDLAAAAIGPDLVRFYSVSGWMPVIQPVRADRPPARTHDLVVVVPEGIEVSLPGRRVPETSPGPGLRAWRFVSELPSAELPIVAVRGSREDVRLGGALTLEILRRDGGGDPSTARSHLVSLAALLEDRLGPCPVTRLALVESGFGGFREAPGWIALSDLLVPRGDADQFDESKQVFLFLGLSMARLWVIHAGAPTGLGARPVAMGLCEHLAATWAAAAVKDDLPERQRGLILGFAQADPELDRPLRPEIDDPRTPPIFKQGKARIVFDMYEQLVGAEAWREILGSWAREVPHGAPIDTLLARMGGTPERDAFVEAFFRRQGASQVSIADVRLVPLPPEQAARAGLDPDAWRRVEIELDNAGLGPVPVNVRVVVDQAVRHERLVLPEYGRGVLAFPAAAMPTRIRVDPERILWQARSDDDAWPPIPKTKRKELGEIGFTPSGDVRQEDIQRAPR